MLENKKVPKRIANSIMNALKGGVVPRTGLGYIAVGRDAEISALLKDNEIIEDGGATFRFVTGNYGSGKTFLLQTIKEHALAKGFVVADADLSPERSLIGSVNKKKGLATFRELMGNISIKTSPTGAALEKILDNWLDSMWEEVAQNASRYSISEEKLLDLVANRIQDTILRTCDMVDGFDFVNVLFLYWKAKQAGDQQTKANALRWLRGEYRTKAEAQYRLGVSNIIGDDDWFTYVKIYARFFVSMGYKGFIIMIDEMINIYKYSHPVTRQRNYECMLNMYNDALQGKAQYLGIIMGGTPKSVEDPTRGVFSYEALRSRLTSGRFQSLNVVNLMNPIIRIQPLSKSEIVVLLEKITEIHSDIYEYESFVAVDDIIGFVEMILASSENTFITPRSIIRDYINLLDILYQNPQKTIKNLMDEYEYSSDQEEEPDEVQE